MERKIEERNGPRGVFIFYYAHDKIVLSICHLKFYTNIYQQERGIQIFVAKSTRNDAKKTTFNSILVANSVAKCANKIYIIGIMVKVYGITTVAVAAAATLLPTAMHWDISFSASFQI